MPNYKLYLNNVQLYNILSSLLLCYLTKFYQTAPLTQRIEEKLQYIEDPLTGQCVMLNVPLQIVIETSLTSKKMNHIILWTLQGIRPRSIIRPYCVLMSLIINRLSQYYKRFVTKINVECILVFY